jgi:DNA-binding NarL/FixJ family response regulator
MTPIRVALVENLERVHRMYRRILEQVDGIVLAGAFHYPEELMAALDDGLVIDAVMMDVRMDEALSGTVPGHLDGIEAACLLRQQRPRLPIVLYTMWDDPQFYRRIEAARLQSHYAVLKRYAIDVDRIGEMLRSVVRGFVFVDDEIQVEMKLQRAWHEHSPLRLLENDDQRKVFALLGDGLSNEEIAKTLGMRPRRVEDLVRVIYETLGLSNDGTSDTRRIRAARMYQEDRLLLWESDAGGRLVIVAQDAQGAWRPLEEVKREVQLMREDAKIMNHGLP